MKDLLARLNARPLLALELLLASLFINLLALASPLFFILVFNRYVTSGFDGTLYTLSAGIVLAVILKTCFGLVRDRLSLALSGDREEVRPGQAFLALIQARTALLDKIPMVRAMDAVQGPRAAQAAYSPQNIGAVLDAPFALFAVILVFLLSPLLGAVALGGLFLTVLLGVYGLWGTRRPSRELERAAATGRQAAVQALQEPDTVRVFGCRDFLVRIWEDQGRRVRELRRFVFTTESISQHGIEGTVLLMRAAVIALGAWLVVQGSLSVGAVIGASFLAALPVSVASRFLRALAAFARAGEQEEHSRELTALPTEPQEGRTPAGCRGRLEFLDLAYAWPGAPGPLFESLNLRLEPGRFLAVTGRNGTGKSTLARLIMGLLEPTRGQILADGLDLRQAALSWWRQRIIYLPQEPGFVNASIRENILLANPDLDQEDVAQVLERAGLKPFLDASPQGPDQLVLDGGRRLSPGIRRRLALARALTTGGELAVLDEPTEALDAEGCRTMIETVKELLREKKTIIAFSNDMRVLSLADVFLDLNLKPTPRITQAAQTERGEQ